MIYKMYFLIWMQELWYELFGEVDAHNTDYNRLNGLKIYKNFINEEEQKYLLDNIRELRYFEHINQVMHFGNLHPFLAPIINKIQQIDDLFTPDIIEERNGILFDQSIINKYNKGEGIKSHVDLLKFKDGILSISLLSSCVIYFTKIKTNVTIPFVLDPGDVLTINGEARYDWEHEIKFVESELYCNKTIERSGRISITLRKLNYV